MRQVKEFITESAVASANKVTAGGAGASIISGVTLNEWGIIIGIVVAVLGYITSTIISVWFKRESLKILRDHGDRRRRKEDKEDVQTEQKVTKES